MSKSPEEAFIGDVTDAVAICEAGMDGDLRHNTIKDVKRLAQVKELQLGGFVHVEFTPWGPTATRTLRGSRTLKLLKQTRRSMGYG